MDNNRLTQQFREIADSILLSWLDPEPIEFRREHDAAARRVVAAIRSVDHEGPVVLPSPVNRNGFLLGCQVYTDGRSEEHLIVGYGSRYSSTTKIERVQHVIGGPGSVPIPAAVVQAVGEHYEAASQNEVLMFHNHPHWWANTVFDNTPLASPGDRASIAGVVLAPAQLLRAYTRAGRLLFYVGENRYVRQFRVPPLRSLLRAAGKTRT